jgi:GNAT superfamily N-acetyltransferase
MSPEQYTERELTLRSTVWSDEAYQAWVLVDAGGAIVGSCESYSIPCMFKTGATEPVQTGHTGVVASVFVPTEHRGQRHASVLMSAVRAALHAQGHAASTLYSDVGEKIYRQCGWNATAADYDGMSRTAYPGWSLKLRAATATPDGPCGALELVRETDLHTLLAGEAKRRRALLEAHAAAAIVELPTAAHVMWHVTRARLYARWSSHAVPHAVGAAMPRSAADGAPEFVLWMHDYKEQVGRCVHVACRACMLPHSSKGTGPSRAAARRRDRAHARNAAAS